MISKQKISQIVIVVIVFILVVSNFSRLIPEEKNYETYTKGLSGYKNNNFSDAYYTLGKVSKYSKIKPAAIYRQALCAERLGDKKTEINKYREIIRVYPNTFLAIRSKYLIAQYQYQDKNFKKAKKEFKHILQHYPETDYAIASKYYLGLIEAEKAKTTKNNKKKLKAQKAAAQCFKAYLKESPTGRFAINSVQAWADLGIKLNNEDNLLIAKTYQDNEHYAEAQKYLKFTNLSISWPYFVQNAYARKDYSKVRYYTEQGLRGKSSNEVLINEDIDEKTERDNIYKAIDDYLAVSISPKAAISYLLSIAQKSNGYDYLLYKNCNNLPVNYQTACFNSLYTQYPNGQFTADALANIFYDKVRTQKYPMAQKLGRKHLAQFKNVNSTPMVMFWLAKISERTKRYEEARSYYKAVIRQYPDDYYAYRAYLNLNKLRRFRVLDLNEKPVVFPYKQSGYDLITILAKVKDYGLISQLCKTDKFVQSWLAYLEGDFATSARVARDAMDALPKKPDKSDLRWRLVYPIQYYDVIKQNARYWNNDPILILSIIREESYFNPKAQSQAGASGLMQLMPATAKEAAAISGITFDNNNLLFDPDINIRLGNVYFSRLKKSLLGKDFLAVLAYNGGMGSVLKWEDNLNYVDIDDFIEQVPYPETQNYLKKVYKSFWNYMRIYGNVRY